jgi:mannosyl-glycoprotein endo-beta-N-acetylglucosaminidase
MNDDTVVADGPLNMRASASTSAAIIAQLADGARCVIKGGPVSAGGYSWYQVSSDGQIGWVAGEFLAHGPRVGGRVQVYTANDGDLNLRSGASTTSSIVASVPQGTAGTVLDGPESSSGYTWWRIQTAAGTGWAAGAFLIPE